MCQLRWIFIHVVLMSDYSHMIIKQQPFKVTCLIVARDSRQTDFMKCMNLHQVDCFTIYITTIYSDVNFDVDRKTRSMVILSILSMIKHFMKSACLESPELTSF